MTASSLDLARRHLESNELEECFWILKDHWLNKPDDVEAVQLLSELFKQVGKDELAAKLAALGSSQEALSTDAQNLFEVGFHFIDERQPALAAMLLERCIKLAPDDPTVNYELGFAVLTLKRYQDAIQYFERALTEIDDFDTRLNLSVAYTCTRQLEPLKKMIEAMGSRAGSDEEVKELKHQRNVLKRLELLSGKKVLSAKDWLFIHYGSILLKQNETAGSGGKFGPLLDDYADVARTLLILRGVLEGMGAEYDVIEYYSSLSRPLAHALGELLNLPYEHYGGPNRAERALLMMGWGSDIIGPHEVFVEHSPMRSIFAYALTWQEPLPVTPELVGCLAESCSLPWGERFRVEQWDDGRPASFERILEEQEGPLVSAEKLLEAASALEADPDILDAVQKVIASFDSSRQLLVLCNSKNFAERPEYTSEIPL